MSNEGIKSREEQLLTKFFGIYMPLTHLRWMILSWLRFGTPKSPLASSPLSVPITGITSDVCTPTISELNLQSALMKSLNAESSEFFEEFNSFCTASCITSMSRSERRECFTLETPLEDPDCDPETERNGCTLDPEGPAPKMPFFEPQCVGTGRRHHSQHPIGVLECFKDRIPELSRVPSEEERTAQ
jgi:hypothetical protein